MRVSAFFRYMRTTLILLGSIVILAACQDRPAPPVMIGQPSSKLVNTIVPGEPAAPEGQVTFAFDPFTGAPGNIADDLSSEIGTKAAIHKINLVRRVGVPSTYRVKGYISVSGGMASTTLFYVFDIIDSSGNRAKRISGVELLGGTAGDPWMAVTQSALSTVADRALFEIAAWANKKRK